MSFDARKDAAADSRQAPSPRYACSPTMSATPSQKFRTAFRKAERAVAALRKGEIAHAEVSKLVNRADDVTHHLEGEWSEATGGTGERHEARERVRALRAQIEAAAEEGRGAVRAARDRELVQLREQERAGKYGEHKGFTRDLAFEQHERELATARLRRAIGSR